MLERLDLSQLQLKALPAEIAEMGASGSNSVSANDLVIQATGLLKEQMQETTQLVLGEFRVHADKGWSSPPATCACLKFPVLAGQDVA